MENRRKLIMILNSRKLLKKILIICAFACYVVSSPFIYAEDETEEHDEHAEEIVRMSNEELEEFGIVVKEARSTTMQLHTDLSGEIRSDPRRIAHIIPRFEGVVKNVRKEIGDKVKKGEILAIIESNESLVKYNMTSAIEGTVIDMHMTPGELVYGDSNHEITVANLDVVWAELSIYQKDLPTIQLGQEAVISPGYGAYKANGKISYISPVIDEATRTASARVLLDNKTGKWKPGMFITAEVLTLEREVPLAVTKNAIQTFEGQKVVFVKEHDGFEPRPITIGVQNDKSVEIISGLHEGESYIAQGAFTLKAELMK
jgi:cobalt-zinc-cadmium efflux system membrane fusion protein